MADARFTSRFERPSRNAPAIDVVESIGGIEPAAWNALAGELSFSLGHSVLRAVEVDRTMAARYLLAREPDGRVVGALPAYVWDGETPIAADYDHFASLVARAVRPVPPRADWFPALLCGSRAGFVNDLLVDPRVPAAKRRDVVRALVAGAASLADDERAGSIAFPYLRHAAALEVLSSQDAGAVPFQSALEAVIPIRWPTFDAYLAALPWHRRGNVRRELRRFAESGCVVETGRLSAWHEAMAPLLAQVLRRYDRPRPDEHARTILEARARYVDEQAVVFLCRRDGRLVAFSICYETASTVYVAALGFDYEATEGTAAYFELTFYAPIRRAIERAAAYVHLGAGSPRPKLLRGAVVSPTVTVVLPPSRDAGELRAAATRWNDRVPGLLEASIGDLAGAFPATAWGDLPPTASRDEAAGVTAPGR